METKLKFVTCVFSSSDGLLMYEDMTGFECMFMNINS